MPENSKNLFYGIRLCKRKMIKEEQNFEKEKIEYPKKIIFYEI